MELMDSLLDCAALADERMFASLLVMVSLLGLSGLTSAPPSVIRRTSLLGFSPGARTARVVGASELCCLMSSASEA